MLFLFKPKPTKRAPAPAKQATLIPPEIGGLRVRPSARARRYGLRVDSKAGDIVFVWPLRSRVTAERALEFIEQHRGWIDDQRRKSAETILFAPGTVVPVAGKDYVIEHAPGRGVTRFVESRLVVHGGLEHLPRRVRDFLKEEAARVLQRLSDEKAAGLGLGPVAVRILDPRTRWGSCGPDGRLMYSWRLLLAPFNVMDYVVAHEVSHRVHLNHGRRFWALCEKLAPDMAACRRWLRRNGRQLLAYR